MPIYAIAGVAVLLLLVALLYSSVGHAGASSYLAVMALLAVPATVIRPTVLVLNVLVATIATVRFYHAGHFSWRLFWPFAAGSIPAAFLGGTLTLPSHIYKIAAGIILLYSAGYMLVSKRAVAETAESEPPFVAALAIGAGIGLVSGLIGVGGGIFLSPILLFMGWAGVRQAAAVAALFILVNSVAGITGQLSATLFSSVVPLAWALALWGAAVTIGGTIGSTYGSRRLPASALRHALVMVLVIAGAKLILV